MDSKTKTSFKGASANEEEYEPVDGSWVAELEDAKAALAEAFEEGGASARRGELLQLNLRLCRSRSILRQWDELQEAADEGSKMCASYNAKSGSAAAARISEWKGRFVAYREQARREMSVPSNINDPFLQGIVSMYQRGPSLPCESQFQRSTL